MGRSDDKQEDEDLLDRKLISEQKNAYNFEREGRIIHILRLQGEKRK